MNNHVALLQIPECPVSIVYRCDHCHNYPCCRALFVTTITPPTINCWLNSRILLPTSFRRQIHWALCSNCWNTPTGMPSSLYEGTKDYYYRLLIQRLLHKVGLWFCCCCDGHFWVILLPVSQSVQHTPLHKDWASMLGHIIQRPESRLTGDSQTLCI